MLGQAVEWLVDEEESLTAKLAYRNLFWGATLMLVGSSLVAFSLVYQKKAHGCDGNLGQTNFLSVPWMAAMSAYAAGSLFNFFGQGMVPQTLCAGLGGYTLGASVLLSGYILKERVHRHALIGICFVISSLVLAAYSVPRAPTALPSLAGFAARATQPSFLTAHLVVASLVASLLYANRQPSRMLYMGFNPANSYGLALALVAAVCSELCQSCTKVLSEAGASYEFNGGDSLVAASNVVLLVAAGLFGIAQMYCLNIALANGRAVEVLPTYYSFDILLQAVAGMTLFQDLHGLDILARCQVFTAVGGIVTGIVFIGSGSWHAQQTQKTRKALTEHEPLLADLAGPL